MPSNKAQRRLQVVHPDCAGIDIGKAKHYVAVDPRHGEGYIRSFDAFTDDLEALEERLHGFARYYEAIAKPFEWKFTRADLDSLLDRMGRARTKDKTRLVKAA